jgi:hypothetical protein
MKGGIWYNVSDLSEEIGMAGAPHYWMDRIPEGWSVYAAEEY